MTSDPYIREVGTVTDSLDGLDLTVGVDYDTVTLGNGLTRWRFTLSQAEKFDHLFLAARREAGENARRMREEAEPETCITVAIVGQDRYLCHNHEGGVHHFAAHWPACPAPWCKLPPGHRGLHDVPSGKPRYEVGLEPDATRAPAAGGTEEEGFIS